MILYLILVNTLGWLALQLSVAAVAVRMDSNRFAKDNWIYRVHPYELRFYRRFIHIRRWKRMLPDGGPWVGASFHKKTLHSTKPVYLHKLVIETRRGEAAHWVMLASFPIFFLWNPLWARLVVILYATLANLPCIVVQRYNRAVVQRVQLHRSSQASSPLRSCEAQVDMRPYIKSL